MFLWPSCNRKSLLIRGDLQVHIKVRTPTDLNDEQKKLFRQLAHTFGSSNNTPAENKSFFDKVKDVFSGG